MMIATDVSDTTVSSDIFVNDVKTAVKATKESKKRPDTRAIREYHSNTSEILKDPVS